MTMCIVRGRAGPFLRRLMVTARFEAPAAATRSGKGLYGFYGPDIAPAAQPQRLGRAPRGRFQHGCPSPRAENRAGPGRMIQPRIRRMTQ